MFRDVYKQVNEEIKGDRAILDKAFLRAAQPMKKKSPIVRYSVVGTLAAAVFIMGAVFVNSDLFTDKIENLPESNNVFEATEEATGAVGAFYNKQTKPVNDNATTFTEIISPDYNNDSQTSQAPGATRQTDKNAPIAGEDNTTQMPAVTDTPVVTDLPVAEEPVNENTVEQDIAAASLEDEDLSDEVTEEYAIMTFTNPDGNDEEGESDMKSAGGSSVAEVTDSNADVEAFSYMYDTSTLGQYTKGVITEGFVNTEVSPVTDSEDARERAKAECTVEYDTVNVYYDMAEKMWKVVFSKAGFLGGNQDVYMNSEGITTLIVYGE